MDRAPGARFSSERHLPLPALPQRTTATLSRSSVTHMHDSETPMQQISILKSSRISQVFWLCFQQIINIDGECSRKLCSESCPLSEGLIAPELATLSPFQSSKKSCGKPSSDPNWRALGIGMLDLNRCFREPRLRGESARASPRSSLA